MVLALLRYALPRQALMALALTPHLLLPLPTQAIQWRWRFERPADANGPAVLANGILLTTNLSDSSGFFTITSLAGERNGVAITSLLPAGTAIPGNCTNASTCFTGDNLLRSAGSAPQLTSHGFGVGFADGTFANYFHASFLTPPVDMEYFSAPPFGFIPPASEDSELPGVFHATTPVPGPLPLGGALLSLGWARRLRKRLGCRCGAGRRVVHGMGGTKP